MRFDLVVIDTETTGLEYDRHRMIQIGVATVKGGRIVNTWESKLRLIDGEVSEYAMQVNGLDPVELRSEKYPHPKTVLRHLQEHFLLPGVILGGHNLSFDLGFLQAEFERHGLPKWEGDFADSMALARALLPDISASLESLTQYFNVKLTRHHDALADAVATAYVLVKLLALAEKRGLNPYNLLIDRPGRPIRYRPENARVATQEEILAELAEREKALAAASTARSSGAETPPFRRGFWVSVCGIVNEAAQKVKGLQKPIYPLLPSPREALAYAREHQSGARFVVNDDAGRNVEVVVRYRPIKSPNPAHRHKLQRYQIFFEHGGRIHPFRSHSTEVYRDGPETLCFLGYTDAYNALTEASIRQWLAREHCLVGNK